MAVLVAGAILLALGIRWPEHYDAWGEAAVGVMLIGVGAWAIRGARKLHFHSATQHGDHAHLHTHGTGTVSHDHPAPESATTSHSHRRGVTLVGLAHGLAGTSSVVALVPVTVNGQPTGGAVYLVAFGVGTILAMMGFAMVAALVMKGAAGRSLPRTRLVGQWVGIAGILVGAVWIYRALSES